MTEDPGTGQPRPSRPVNDRQTALWERLWPRRLRILLIPLMLMLLVELVLSLADRGLIGSPRWRMLAYQFGAFWPGLLSGWQPNFPGQGLLMFATHVFLHGGPGHLFGNIFVIALLLPELGRRLGRDPLWRLGLICGLAAVMGGLAYAALHNPAQPMVGASGVAFGLAIAQQMARGDSERAAGDPGAPARRLWLALGGLSLLNLISWMMLDGQLAWETHFGGMIGGVIGWWLIGPRQPHRA